MIKSFIRNTAIYMASLFILPYFIAGVKIFGGIQTLIIGSFVLTLMFILLKPIFNVLTFPFNIITLGLFSIITNAVILYLLTVFVPNIAINAFRFNGGSLAGFSINPIEFNVLFAFIASSVVLSSISGLIRWIFK